MTNSMLGALKKCVGKEIVVCINEERIAGVLQPLGDRSRIIELVNSRTALRYAICIEDIPMICSQEGGSDGKPAKITSIKQGVDSG